MKKITLFILIICCVALLVPIVSFFVIYKDIRSSIIKENLDEKTAKTASVLNGELRNDCLGEFNYFIENYGADYSKCFSKFSFDGNYCGWFDIENQSLSNVNIVVILDASGSMAGSVGGARKIDVAKKAISNFLINVPKGINTGLIVYGNKGSGSYQGKEASCREVDEIVPLSQNNSSKIISAMSSFGPNGWTAIAKSLDFAGKIFETRRNDRNYLILVSDGIETCDGKPAESAKNLIAISSNIKLNIIGFGDLNEKDGNSLRAIAIAGKGTYISAKNSADIAKEFNRQLAFIKKSCLSSALQNAFLKYKNNDSNNLACWLSAYDQESKDYKDLERFFNPICRTEVSTNLTNRGLDFWNQKQAIDKANEEVYKAIEKDLNQQLNIIGEIK